MRETGQGESRRRAQAMPKDRIQQEPSRPRPSIDGVPLHVEAAVAPGWWQFVELRALPAVNAHIERATQFVLLGVEEAWRAGDWHIAPIAAAMRLARVELYRATAAALADGRSVGFSDAALYDNLRLVVQREALARLLPRTNDRYRPARDGGLPRDLEDELRRYMLQAADTVQLRVPVPPERRHALERFMRGERGRAFQGPRKGQRLALKPGQLYPSLDRAIKLCGSGLTLERLAGFMHIDRKMLQRYLNHPEYGPTWEQLRVHKSLAGCVKAGCPAPPAALDAIPGN
jgi:hypothetical protein